jgi:hypothetical protein
MADAGTVTFNLDANSVRLMRELQKAERGSRRTTQKIRRDFEQMGRRVAIAATAIAAATTAIVRAQAQAIDELAKTADALGVSTENLQALQHVAKLTGTSAEQLSKGMERMQRSLGEAARKGGLAADALADVGLSVDDVLGMSADKQLEVLAKALSNVEDASVRASIENDLFGRGALRMRKLMNQLATEGLDPVKRELEALGFAVSRTQAAGVERMNDSLEKAQLVGRGAAQMFTVGLSPAVAAMAEQFIGAAKESGTFADAALEAGEKVGTGLAFIADVVESVKRVFQVWGRTLAVTFMAMESGAYQFAYSLYNGPGAAINWLLEQASKIPGIDIDFRVGEVGPELRGRVEELERAIAVGLSDINELLLKPLPSTGIEERLKKIRAELADFAGSIDVPSGDGLELDIDITPAEAKLAALREQVATFGLDEIEAELFKLATLEGFSPQMLDDARQMLAWLRDAGAAADEFAEKQKAAASLFDQTRTPLEKFNAEIQRLNELRDTFVDGKPLIDADTYNRAVEAAQDALENADKTFNAIEEFSKQAARNMQDHFADFLFDPFQDGLKGMLRGFIDILRRMAAEAAAAQIFESIGGIKGVGDFLGGIFGGKRASGGSVSPSKGYIVGERGPEWFMPNTAGTIVPNHSLGGVTVNIDARNNNDPASILSLVPVIQSQIENSMSLKMRRGYL